MLELVGTTSYLRDNQFLLCFMKVLRSYWCLLWNGGLPYFILPSKSSYLEKKVVSLFYSSMLDLCWKELLQEAIL